MSYTRQRKYNMEISNKKTEVLAFQEESLIGNKIVLHGKPIQEVSTCKYIGCNVFQRSLREAKF